MEFIPLGADHILHRETMVHKISIAPDINCFQHFKECRSVIPIHLATAVHHIVTLQCADWNEPHITNIQFFFKRIELFTDIFEYLFAVIHQVHFVDTDQDMRNTQQ